MIQRKFAVIGGDFRNLKLAEILKDEGYSVNTFALSEGDCATKEQAMRDAEFVIGPIPLTNDGKTLNTPLYRENIYINDFLKTINEKSILIAGKLEEYLRGQINECKLRGIDILQREDFSVLNAIPTAEGAIQIALQETSFTLNSSNILITGYGRIGKVLANMLKGLGANVFISTKQSFDNAYSVAFGFSSINLCDIKKQIHKMDIAINTVPEKVINKDILETMNKDTLIIDLASKPGGVDFDKAKELGIKTIWALSLPGKVAPLTSAKIIRDIIFNIIAEMEV
jgi:dipicolinate synthase subunit A